MLIALVAGDLADPAVEADADSGVVVFAELMAGLRPAVAFGRLADFFRPLARAILVLSDFGMEGAAMDRKVKATTGHEDLEEQIERLRLDALTHRLAAKMLGIHLKALAGAFGLVEREAATMALAAIEQPLAQDVRGLVREAIDAEDASRVCQRVIDYVLGVIVEAQAEAVGSERLQ